MNISGFFKKYSIIANLLLAGFIFISLILCILKWLESYTCHGEAVEIPDVKGLRIEDAASVFQGRGLDCAVADSVFVKNAIPGTIIETSPPVGTHVKKRRTIFLTINSFSAQLLTVPDITDMSQRHAQSLLRSIGFTTIQERYVPGAFRGLAVGLENRGKLLSAGDKVAIDAFLTLLVSSGVDITEAVDSTLTEEESWY
ncbi:MAG: PASTA domain-containing protein [Dysgonamonadaceae bacterium]|jgi:beta-lactam-binding protein with PASTA domain|nr:PASTA domain-containing protein [Dysgonamonadaceae bacterium]